MWSYAKRAIGTHVLRQKHWPGNAMMHPPDPNTFATSVATRLVLLVAVFVCFCCSCSLCCMFSVLLSLLLGTVAAKTGCSADRGPNPPYLYPLPLTLTLPQLLAYSQEDYAYEITLSPFATVR